MLNTPVDEIVQVRVPSGAIGMCTVCVQYVYSLLNTPVDEIVQVRVPSGAIGMWTVCVQYAEHASSLRDCTSQSS